MPSAIAIQGVAAVAYIGFSEAGVAAHGLPNAYFVCCSSGSFFLHRLLASVGIPRIPAGRNFAGRMANAGRRVAFGPKFHGDLEFWR